MQGWKLGRKTTPSWCFKEEDCSTLWITRRVEVYCEGWLESPHVEAVEEFRKALEESEKAAAQEQQRQQQQGQKKSP